LAIPLIHFFLPFLSWCPLLPKIAKVYLQSFQSVSAKAVHFVIKIKGKQDNTKKEMKEKKS